VNRRSLVGPGEQGVLLATNVHDSRLVGIIIVTWWQRLIERFRRFWRQPCAVIATSHLLTSCLMNGDRVAHSTSTRQWSVGKAR
jgi:hypothetical protein